VRLSTQTVFKTAGFNHSPIPPTSILPDSINLQGVSLCHFFSLFLGTGVTTLSLLGKLRHCSHLRIVIRVRVAHGGVDCRMPQELLHGHQVHTGARQPRGERMPQCVPGDAGQTGPFQNRLEASLQVAKPVTRDRVVENTRGRVSPRGFFGRIENAVSFNGTSSLRRVSPMMSDSRCSSISTSSHVRSSRSRRPVWVFRRRIRAFSYIL
jgi:hypothetical protein